MTVTPENKLLSFAEARQIVEQHAAALTPTEPEFTSLLDGVGQVLAEDLLADRDFPPFPRATRDGYAVRAADVQAVPARLHCVGTLKAGATVEESGIRVGPGEAVEIMTGAPVPAGADAVVMVEYTESEDATVTVKRAVKSGENVVAAGAEAHRGDVMVERGTRVQHAVVAVAAAVGRPEVAVYRRPSVAVLATGDELVDVNLPPGPNEIRNSNSYSLAAQVYEAGGEAVILPVARDEAGELAILLRKGLDADLLLLSGGVSMGKYDLVEEVLASLGAKFFFTGVAMQPGKPVVFGEVALNDKTTPFFGLPGNPVSTMVTFQLFVRPVLDALGGAKPEPLPFAQAILKAAVHDQDWADAISAGETWRDAREARGGTGALAGVGRPDGGVEIELLHCGTSRSRAFRGGGSGDGAVVLKVHGKGQGKLAEAVALRRCRAGVDGGRVGQESHIAGGRGARVCCDEPEGFAGAAAESQGRSAGSGADCGDPGGQAHLRADSDVPSGAAEQGRCHLRGEKRRRGDSDGGAHDGRHRRRDGSAGSCVRGGAHGV